MRIRNHFRLAATMVTFAWAATAHAAPPNRRPDATPSLMARASVPVASTGLRAVVAPLPSAPSASGSAKAPTAVERAALLRSGEVKLAGEDVETVEQGFVQLAQLGGPDAVKIVVARVRRGLPPQLIEPALEALLSFRQPSVSPVLLELALHRRWQVRQQAIVAIGTLGVRSAQPSILYALDDPSDQVRASAVHTLGMIGDSRALPALGLAMDRKVEGAAAAIGKLGQAKEAELLLERARKGELAMVEGGLREMLVRKNLPLPLKLKIVTAVAQLGSSAANEVLSAWAKTWSEGDVRVLQALNATTMPAQATALAVKTSSVPSPGGKP